MNKKIYKAKKSYYLSNGIALFVIIFLMTLVSVRESYLERNQIVGILGFWVIGIFLILTMMTMRIEIDGDEVRSYILGFCILKVKSTQVRKIYYGNLMTGGLGYGKGLFINFSIGGRTKTVSIGEKLYGKEAIEEIKNVLDD